MLGDIVVCLYDVTPIHRDNFLKLAKDGYYDGTLFHRVIKSLSDMLEIGLKHTSELTVSEALTAILMGSGDMPVLATPAMMAFEIPNFG